MWYIGPEGNCAAGTAGLYIANKADTTKNAAAPVTGPLDFIVAYREGINLGAPGTYILSFDWKALGKTADMLSVFWFPSTYTKNTNSAYGAGRLFYSPKIFILSISLLLNKGGITPPRFED